MNRTQIRDRSTLGTMVWTARRFSAAAACSSPSGFGRRRSRIQELRMTEVIGDGKALIEQIAKALVDDPAQVAVDEYEDEGEQVLELTVAEGDLGKIIGRSGRTARALRTVLAAAGLKLHKRYALEIVE
jgi:predicted RNA-binding protein YlqC (UPF0109 family)